MRGFIFATMILAVLSANKAQAGIITYFSSTELEVEIFNMSGVSASASSTIFGPPTTSGNGVGIQSFTASGNPTSLGVGDILRSFSSVTGSSPPDSDANALGAGRITFINMDLDPGSFTLLARWKLNVNTTTGAAITDFGLAQVSPFLLRDGNEQLNNGAGVFLASNTAFGGGSFDESNNELYNFSIMPNETIVFDIGAASYGSASSTIVAVPEQSSGKLLCIGLPIVLLLARFGRKKKQPAAAIAM